MRIGLIDVDAQSRGKVKFPNLALMKISAYHKQRGDHVEWYNPLLSPHMDKVYMSKVFGDEYTEDYPYFVDADEIVKGGSGYAIRVVGGKEVYIKELDPPLPAEIDHIMPDYSLYSIYDTAYGFLTKGCPNNCDFCHVCHMQGRYVYTFSRLSEWWSGQKNIVLLDPNLTASKDWDMHIQDLIDSGAMVDFTQGLDLRLLNEKKVSDLNKVKWKSIHFAWDRPEQDMRPMLDLAMHGLQKARKETVTVYVLTNYNSTHEQDLHRVMQIRAAGAQPYVMVYRKPTAPTITRRLQRWVNSPRIFWSTENFGEYK